MEDAAVIAMAGKAAASRPAAELLSLVQLGSRWARWLREARAGVSDWSVVAGFAEAELRVVAASVVLRSVQRLSCDVTAGCLGQSAWLQRSL